MDELKGAGGRRAGAGRKPAEEAAKRPVGRPKGRKDSQPRETRALGQTLPTDASAVLVRMVEANKEALLAKVLEMALAGDKGMMQYVLDQTIGKPGTKTVNNPDTTIIIRTLVPRDRRRARIEIDAGNNEEEEATLHQAENDIESGMEDSA